MSWGDPHWVMTEAAMRRWMKQGIPDEWTVAEAFVSVEGKLSSDLVEFRFEPHAAGPNPLEQSYQFKLRGPNFTFVADRPGNLREVSAWIDDGEGIIANCHIVCDMVLRTADAIHFQLG